MLRCLHLWKPPYKNMLIHDYDDPPTCASGTESFQRAGAAELRHFRVLLVLEQGLWRTTTTQSMEVSMDPQELVGLEEKILEKLMIWVFVGENPMNQWMIWGDPHLHIWAAK